MNVIYMFANLGVSMIWHNVRFAQLFRLLIGSITMPKTPLQCLQGKKPLQRLAIANLDLSHLGALLPSTAVQLPPRIVMVATQQDLNSYS